MFCIDEASTNQNRTHENHDVQLFDMRVVSHTGKCNKANKENM